MCHIDCLEGHLDHRERLRSICEGLVQMFCPFEDHRLHGQRQQSMILVSHRMVGFCLCRAQEKVVLLQVRCM